MKHLGDITKLHGYDIPVVDVITGGSPCQDLSIAGKRAGLGGERSGLFMEQIRIVKEMREHDRRTVGRTGQFIRPRYMVWENVPGAFSSNKGEDFQAVLTEIVRVTDENAADVPMPEKGKWSRSGCLYDEMGRWSVAWRVHDAQFWGVPQRRKRISLVADFGGETAPEILFERKSVSGDITEGGKQGENVAADVRLRIEETGRAISFQERAGKPGGGKGILIQNERTGALSTLNSTEHHAVAVENHPADSRVKISEDGMVQTLSSRMGTGGGNVPMVMEPVCVGNGQADQTGLHEVVGALNCMHDQQAVITYGLDRASFNQGANAKYGFSIEEEKIGAQVARGPGAVCQSVVRRLTPLECERLQGFPDGWTDIGEWTDSKGKRHKSADSPRYKALGNSIATPFWFWLLRRLSAQYERPATLGSLFDGIGGFPYCWERCNGRGTAIWASEIEEFPIAVTKVHFPEE